jgi:SSS family solute:Na+ symporter/sodium/proline symporter
MTQVQVTTVIALGLFAMLMVCIGVFSYRRTQTLDGFLLGGRNIGAWMSAFSYGTSYFSAVVFVGYAGKHGWDIGIGSVWIGIGNALLGCLLSWLLFAKKTRNMTHHIGSKTMPEFFEIRYQSKGLKIFAAIIIFVFLVPYSAAVYKGLGTMFNMIFPSVSVNYCMLAIAVLTAVYLVLGGYLATSYTDFIQGIVMIVGIVCMVVAVFRSDAVGGFSEAFSRLAAIPDNGDGVTGAQLTSLFGGSSFRFLCVNILLTSFGTWGLPQMVAKYYAIKEKSSIKQATVISTVFCLIIGCGAYLTGSLSRLVLGNTLPAGGNDSVIPAMLMKTLGNSGFSVAILALILLLLLSASMSTLASVVLTSASAISVDLLPVFKKDIKPKTQMLLTRALCFLFVALSFLFASSNISIIVNIMSFSWGTVSGCFIGAYIWGIFSKKVTKMGAWAGMLAGFASVLLPTAVITITKGFASAVSFAPQMGVIAMAVSFATVPIVSLFTKKPSTEHISFVFNTDKE